MKTPAFVDDTAKKTGRGRSTIARDAKHAKDVAVLPEIAGTSLDSDSEIESLSKLPVHEQHDLAEQAIAGIEVTAKPATPTLPPAADADHHDDLARMLSLSHILLHDSGVDVEKAVAKVGTSMVREIIGRLKKALDKHNAASAVATKADAAEPKTIKATPAADCPGIPPFLDRRQTAGIDEEAAKIAEQAAREKRWMQ